MNFVGLCEQLAEKFGTASVCFAEYPGLGVRRTEFAEFVLRKDEALYEVGSVELGEWRSVAEFRSETEGVSSFSKNSGAMRRRGMTPSRARAAIRW